MIEQIFFAGLLELSPTSVEELQYKSAAGELYSKFVAADSNAEPSFGMYYCEILGERDKKKKRQCLNFAS